MAPPPPLATGRGRLALDIRLYRQIADQVKAEVGGGAALIVASAGAGLVAAGVAQGWLGVLGGDWLVNAGVLGLTVLAVGATVIGLAALFGRAGAALGALLMVLVGNPLSGSRQRPSCRRSRPGPSASCSRRGRAAACRAAPPSSTAPPPAAPWSC